MTDQITTLVIIVLLLAANAFFVAAEFALVKVRHMRIAAMADQGNATARMARRIKEYLEAYLAACQLGITMASLGLGWVGEPFVAALLEPAFARWGFGDATLHTVSFLAGFIIFSSLHIVIGEQVPKTYAIRKPEPVSLWVAWPLHAFYLLAWPLNMSLNWASRSLLHLMGVQEAGHEEVFRGEEISEMIDTSRDHGHLEHGKAEMLKNLFDFDQRTVSEVMRPRGDVDLLDLAQPADVLRALVQETGHSRFPVVRGGNDDVLGLILVKDIFSATLSGSEDVWTNLDPLVRPALIVPENIGVGALFEAMKTERSHMALVVDEYGSFAGMATLEDLLEEIVGEIDDELDHEPALSMLTPNEQGWMSNGLAELRDIDRALGTRFNERHAVARTLSGLLMNRLGRLPREGDTVKEEGLCFTVITLEGRRAGQVQIERTLVDDAPAADDESA